MIFKAVVWRFQHYSRAYLEQRLPQRVIFLDKPKIHIPKAKFCIRKGSRELGLGG